MRNKLVLNKVIVWHVSIHTLHWGSVNRRVQDVLAGLISLPNIGAFQLSKLNQSCPSTHTALIQHHSYFLVCPLRPQQHQSHATPPASNLDMSSSDLQNMSGRSSFNRSSVRFTFPSKIKVDNAKCIICQEQFNTGMKPEIPIALPGCGHVFGSVCIAQWLHTAERNHGCPLCRRQLFRRLHENLIEVEDEDEQIAGDEEDHTFVRLTPIDAPFVPSDLANEFQGWIAFRDRQSVGNPFGLDLQGEQQELLPNETSPYLVNDEGGSLDDSTSAALRHFLGDCPSTEAVIEAMRRRHIESYEIAIEGIVEDRRDLFNGNPDRRPSYAEQTRLVYSFVQMSFRLAAEWLREHPPHNDLHLRCLYTVLETSLVVRAADFRDHDITRLTNLIKAGVISSPRIEGSFDSRMRMSQDVPEHIESLRRGESEPRPYMAQWMRAMPLLTSAVRQIAESERLRPLHINDIDCERLWNEDMKAIPLVDLPGGTSRAVEPTVNPLPSPTTDPTVPPVGSLGSVEAEDESNGMSDTEHPRPQLGQDIMYTENDFPWLPQVLDRTMVSADSPLQRVQPSLEAEHSA